MAGSACGAVRQPALAERNTMRALQEVVHKSFAFFSVYPREVTRATSLWLIQRMRLGTNILAIYNIVVPVTGNTAYWLGFSSDCGSGVYTAVKLRLRVVVAGRAIDFG